MERNLRVFSNLESLQADFPGFVIWGETIRGRVTHVAPQPTQPATVGYPRVAASCSLDRLRSRLEEPAVASDHRPPRGRP
jgi:acyl dehydratase